MGLCVGGGGGGGREGGEGWGVGGGRGGRSGILGIEKDCVLKILKILGLKNFGGKF